MELTVRGTPIRITTGAVIFGLLGLALVGYGGYDYVQQSSAVDDAVEVNATVVETSITEIESGRSGIEYDATVEFTYRYRGTEYTSDKRYPGSFSEMYDTRTEAESALEQYDDGETVTAYVDPDDPGEGFLNRQTSQGPLHFAAIGGLVLLLIGLDAVGARRPGQGTELRPASEHEPTRYRTLFGVDRDAINRISKRSIKWAAITFPLSLVGVALILIVSGAGNQVAPERHVGLLDPVGLLLGIALLALLTLLVSLALYSVWSFTEYRRVRERIPEPRPLSPFRHPTRLVTILLGNYDLDAYGKRVQRTGFAVVVTLFLVGVFVQLIVF